MFTFPVSLFKLSGPSIVTLAGNVNIPILFTGNLSIIKPLAGAIASSVSLAGAVSLTKVLAGDIAISSSLANDLSLIKPLAGDIAISTAIAGALADTFGGNIVVSAALVGDLSLIKVLAGDIVISSSLTNSLSLTKVLMGDIAIVSSLAGDVSIQLVETVALMALFTGSYTSNEQANINNLIAGLKTDGLWETIDVLKIVAGSKTINDATRNWKQNAYHSTISGTLNYITGRNFSGFSNSNYLSDGFVPSSAGGNFVRNSATIAIYNTGDGQSGNVAIGGNNSANAVHSQIVLRDSSNRAAITNNATSSQTVSAANTIYSAVGLTTNTRTASNAIAIYKNAALIATGSTASTGNLPVQTFTGAQNNNGSPASADTNLALVAEVKASGWSAAQVGNFYSRINSYLQTLKTNTYTLTYSSNGDTNGLFYLLGTNMGMRAWANPAQDSYIDSDYTNNYAVLLSASTIKGGSLGTLTNRATASFYTENVAGSWIKVDLGGFRTLSCNGYSIRNYSMNGDWLRSWKLQGSNDNNTWVDLDIRINDTTFNAPNVWATYTPNQNVATAFRWFRILNTGLTSSGSNYLCLGEWEMYGALTIGSPTTFTNSGLNGDNAGIIYYLASTQAAENWTNGWVNPHATGIVTVSASSVGSGNVSMLVGRLPNSFYTANSAGSWIQLDFGPSRTVRVDSYQLRHSNFSSNYLRNWKLQGSMDGSTWTDLDVRSNDATITARNQFANFTPSVGNTSFWRYIRLLSTGVDSNSANFLCLGQIELYGAIA